MQGVEARRNGGKKSARGEEVEATIQLCSESMKSTVPKYVGR